MDTALYLLMTCEKYAINGRGLGVMCIWQGGVNVVYEDIGDM